MCVGQVFDKMCVGKCRQVYKIMQKFESLYDALGFAEFSPLPSPWGCVRRCVGRMRVCVYVQMHRCTDARMRRCTRTYVIMRTQYQTVNV